MISRRRFIALSAGLVAGPVIAQPVMPRLYRTGQALGASTSIRIDHPDASAIAARVVVEISRLDGIFSLYRDDSALMRLNQTGRLDGPPFELLDCLAIAGAVHHASDGAFDPTIQPLWRLWADAVAAGQRPSPEALAETRARTGWEGVTIDAGSISLRPGMALSLNGIGQGYLADRISMLLADEGLRDIFIDTGEFRALGGMPGGCGWPVTLVSGESITLKDRALATSAPRGTTFDQEGRLAHILDPRSGLPTPTPWASVTVSADSAALADALSTAACLYDSRAGIEALIARFADARLEALAAV